MLNADGYLSPGIHDMTMEEIQEAFVVPFPGSTTRPVVFAGYEKHRAELEALNINIEQFIDGSFTTSKTDPSDVDMVCFADANVVDNLPPEKQEALLKLTGGAATKETHHCDAYFCPTLPDNDPLFNQLRAQRKYWMGEFGYDRVDKPKGIVRTQLNPSATP